MAAQQGDSEEVQRILSQEATAYADHADNVAQTMERTRIIMRQAAIDAGENAEETRRNWENGVEATPRTWSRRPRTVLQRCCCLRQRLRGRRGHRQGLRLRHDLRYGVQAWAPV